MRTLKVLHILTAIFAVLLIIAAGPILAFFGIAILTTYGIGLLVFAVFRAAGFQ